ncbi:hypothetical protein SpCBS45565_g05660 [Spizellomyces sp. 'palustris']|nr:hypothetical protein SpCBS45565_g05660 [Spizellomyces sp. 'palustris']
MPSSGGATVAVDPTLQNNNAAEDSGSDIGRSEDEDRTDLHISQSIGENLDDDIDASSVGAMDGDDSSDVNSTGPMEERSSHDPDTKSEVQDPTRISEKAFEPSPAQVNMEPSHSTSSPVTPPPRRPDFLDRRRTYQGPGISRHSSFPSVQRHSRDVSPVRTEYGGEQEADNDDVMSVRSTMTTHTLRANRPRPITKSQKISSIQDIFTESQKIAYVGLCYLSAVHNKKADVKAWKKANESYTKWADAFMERLYAYLDIKEEERVMIKSLAAHGLVPSDLSKSLIDDAKKAAQIIKDRQERRQRAEQEALENGTPFELDGIEDTDDNMDPTDIRYTILTHLFILCIADGRYDARSRAVLKSVANDLEVPWLDVIKLERAIAEQLRIYEDSEEVKGDVEVIGKRNMADSKKRWLFTGLATLAGGAVIGLTAGLAAPLIAGGIGVALGTFGVTGATAALSTTGALALITTGGVLTGGGMGGFKMMKRTKGITQFEFLYIEDALKLIEENKEKRRTERRKRRRREARQALQDKLDQQRVSKEEKRIAEDDQSDDTKSPIHKAEEGTKDEELEDVAEMHEELPRYEPANEERLNRIGSWVSISESQRKELDKMAGDSPGKKIPPPIPNRPTAAELASVAERAGTVGASPAKSIPPRLVVSTTMDAAESCASSSILTSGDDLGLTHDWGLDEGLGLSDGGHDGGGVNIYSETMYGAGRLDTNVLESTLLWESSPQLHSENDLELKSVRKTPSFNAGNLDDVGTIDEDMAAAMFDDLQSTIAGDEDDGIRFKEPEGPPKAKQTNVLLTVAGWITYGPDDHTLPFSTLEHDAHGDQYALCWETDVLQELGSALKLLVGEVASFLVQQGLQATVLSTLMIGLAGPLWVMKLSYLVDNPWGNGLSKANKAGRVLADTLMQGVQENRPVSLIGFSLGARVIFHCLLELAARGAYGIVEDVYLLGCPVMAQKNEWEQIASVVSGRLVNGYSTNDMVLGVLYRASVAVWNNVAGLRPVEGVAGVENIQLDDVIQGHLDYRLCMPKVLEKLGFSVTRDYFDDEDEEEEKERTEIEEEKRKEKEERLRAKEERLKKKQEEYEEKVRKKKEEQERKQKEREEKERLKEEARRKKEAEKAGAATWSGKETNDKVNRLSWFARRSSGRATSTPTQEKVPDEIEKLMESYWMPREIKSTLPPLVIQSPADVIPKEIKTTLPPLVISSAEVDDNSTDARSTGTNAPKSVRENAEGSLPDLTSPPPSSYTPDAPDTSDDLVAAQTELYEAEAEVEAAKKEVAEAAAAAAAAAAGSLGLRVTLENGTELEQIIMAAQKDGTAGAGAGDRLDGRAGVDGQENDDDEFTDGVTPSSPSSQPIVPPEDAQDLGVWHKRSTENIPEGFLDPQQKIEPSLKSPGAHSLMSSSSDDSSGSAFVDARENPWVG